mgnify:CR=1 FL=1
MYAKRKQEVQNLGGVSVPACFAVCVSVFFQLRGLRPTQRLDL